MIKITTLPLVIMTVYQQAKGIYNSYSLMDEDIITIDRSAIPKFRTHLGEFEYRKKEGKKFTTVILDNGQLLVKRIK